MAEDEILPVQCKECGGGFRNHKVLCEHEEKWSNDEDMQGGVDLYQICKCQGCDTIRFRTESWTGDDFNQYTGEYDKTVRIYPEYVEENRKALIGPDDELPPEVDRI